MPQIIVCKTIFIMPLMPAFEVQRARLQSEILKVQIGVVTRLIAIEQGALKYGESAFLFQAVVISKSETVVGDQPRAGRYRAFPAGAVRAVFAFPAGGVHGGLRWRRCREQAEEGCRH